MQLLGSLGCMLRYCYVVARVVHMGLRLFWVVARMFWLQGHWCTVS